MEMKSTIPDFQHVPGEMKKQPSAPEYSRENRGWISSEQQPFVQYLPPYNNQGPPPGTETQSTHHQQRTYGQVQQQQLQPPIVVFQQPTGVAVVQPPTKLENPPKDYLIHSLFATLCCCTCLGILAIMHAVRSREAITAGDHARAVEHSKKARKFMIGTVVFGVIVLIFYFAIEMMLIPIEEQMSSEELSRANIIRGIINSYLTYFM